MENNANPACRLCRREGQNLFLKGTKCYNDKCAFCKHPIITKSITAQADK